MIKKENRYPLILLILFLVVLIWSFIKPHEGYGLWILESFPAIIGAGILILTYKKFRFTNITYTFILIQASVLVIGGHYSYAKNPLFGWLQTTFDLKRNYYDRLGHLLQGLVPALIAREIIMKKNIVKGKAWLAFFVVSICLAISAFYEFIEWLIAIIGGATIGGTADKFLATQGDIWDTQWDMFLAFIGSIIALIFISPFQDKSLKKNNKPYANESSQYSLHHLQNSSLYSF